MSSSEFALVITLLAITAGIAVSRILYERERDIVQDRKQVSGKPWKGAFAAYIVALERVRANPAPLLFFLSVSFLAMLVSMAVQGKPITDVSYKPYDILVYLVFILPLPVYALALADGRKIGLREFMRFSLRKFLMLIVLCIVMLLITIGSMLLFLIPLVWILAWFFAAVFVVAEEGATPARALNESGKLALGHKGKVWGIVGASFILGIGAGSMALLPGVGAYVVAILNGVLSVLYYAATAILYRWLQSSQA